MKYLTTEQMRRADARAIQQLGIPGAVLMDHAGRAVFHEVRPGRVGVVCGKGNNGGDGFVVARYALAAGLPVSVVLLAELDAIRGDARTFMDAYRRLGGTVVVATAEDEAGAAVEALTGCGTLVDAVLGTGISGEVRGVARAAIDAWPGNGYTVAVDTPSGLDTDRGEPCGACVTASVTVSFQWAKTGFQNPAAAPYLGRLEVVDIGIPPVCADDEAWRALGLE